MLLSMKTTMRSCFSFGRVLLWRIALEKDLFTISLFSIYMFNSTSFMSQVTTRPHRERAMWYVLVENVMNGS